MRIEITKLTGPTTVRKQFEEDGDVVDAGTVTYVLRDPSGSTVTSGTATKTGSGTTTAYEVTIGVSETATVNEYELEFERTATGAKSVDQISIVGDALFTESEARAFSVVGGVNPLSDTATYPDAAIAEARYRIQEFLERRCGAAFVRRYARVRVAGNGRREINVHRAEQTHGGPGYRHFGRELVDASVNGVAFTAGQIAAVDVAEIGVATFRRLDGSSWDQADDDQPRLNVTLGYEYGWRSVPYEANRAGLHLLIASIVPSDVSSRFRSFSNEDGTFALNLPSGRTPTGIPFVDEFIGAHDERSLFA